MKIKLKDGTTYAIQDNTTENSLEIQVNTLEEFNTIHAQFTDNNLAEFNILTDSNEITAIYKNKSLKTVTVTTATDGYLINIALTDVEVTKKIEGLEKNVNNLTLAMASLMGV